MKLHFEQVKDEYARVYYFPSGPVRIDGVRRICVRPSGTHRLETKGRKFIIASGWTHIEIFAKSWTL